MTQAEKTKLYRATVTTYDRFRALREEKGAYHPETCRAWDEHQHAKRRWERVKRAIRGRRSSSTPGGTKR